MARQKAILVDIDGTTSLGGDRGIFEFEKCADDKPNVPVIKCVEAMANAGYSVVFSTGREAKFRSQTEAFLKQHFPWLEYELFMRETGDFRKDAIVKRELYENKIVDRFDILFAIDDRRQVVDAYRKELGLTVLQCDYGDF